MKAITLTQPWATLVAIGAKQIETRSWNTTYRGLLAIHAAKGFPRDAQHICLRVPFRDCLGNYGPHNLPLGAIVATCELVKVIRITPFHEHALPQEPEYSFGNYSTGRYMWFLENIKALEEPKFAKGALSLWEWIP